MAALTNEQQTFIVTRLAMFDTPQQVADAVKEEFGLEVDRRQVQIYDPDRAGRKPAKKWCELHTAARESFLVRVAGVPGSRKAVRVARLDRMAQKAEKKGNMPLAATLYEQIAKEMGDAYTNRRILTAGDPAEILAKLTGISADELRALAEEDAT